MTQAHGSTAAATGHPERVIANPPDQSVDAVALEGDQRWIEPEAHGWDRLADRLYALQPERLIRLARFISSAFALLAIYLDPIQPTRNAEETYAVLLAYVIYAGFLVLAPSREALNSRAHYVTHAIDIIVLGVLAFLSGELSSPFLAFFSFALINSAIRWGFAGALLTALMLDILLMAVGWPYDDPSKSDLNALIMRSCYALVAAAMLGYFASYRERGRRRLEQLAAWPIEAAGDGGEAWLERSLRHASKVLGDLPLLVVWNDREEPMGRIAYWDCFRCCFVDISHRDCARLLSSGPLQAGFHQGSLLDAIGLPEPVARNFRHDRVHIARKKPPCCSAPFNAQRYRGRVFVIDPGYPNDDMISLTEIVAERIASELEQFAMMSELATAAGWRERGRLARDLHDSVLQDLTAAGLQIRLAMQQVPESMRDTIGLIGALLQEQQRRIRRFVESTRPSSDPEQHELRAQLDAIAYPLNRQWHCALDIDVSPADLMVSSKLSSEICQMVSEATANAARHGDAHNIRIAVRSSGKNLRLSICDDGKGMSGAGSTSVAEPQSIRARVDDLGGQFRLDTSGPGLTMHIRLAL
ncbi:sensor histidine kinase [Sphingomonas sp. LaA6.9]|uniref:sensor histidine kinase n=1 Tax=Sphingomonas sp. LaA6.9 TaxID=2919914 RepID=UPI001F4F2AC2|nr:histidine kinase [Sphingomonas sp. LaA6.9]MCJ8159140.1 histidine kinase [Sphingomonas sp. LaA6.9]